jgi:PEP-CTERM motif
MRHSLARRTQLAVYLTTLVVGVLLAAVPSLADTVTFNDLTDTLTMSTGTSTTACPASVTMELFGRVLTTEGCIAIMTGPTGSTSFTAPSLTLIGGDNGRVSDAIIIAPDLLNTDMAAVTFLSDPIEEMPFLCSVEGGCPITENGQLQTGAQITWKNASGSNVGTDQIQFRSDAEVVPEPASLVLLGGGLLAMAGYLRRRQSA